MKPQNFEPHLNLLWCICLQRPECTRSRRNTSHNWDLDCRLFPVSYSSLQISDVPRTARPNICNDRAKPWRDRRPYYTGLVTRVLLSPGMINFAYIVFLNCLCSLYIHRFFNYTVWSYLLGTVCSERQLPIVHLHEASDATGNNRAGT